MGLRFDDTFGVPKCHRMLAGVLALVLGGASCGSSAAHPPQIYADEIDHRDAALAHAEGGPAGGSVDIAAYTESNGYVVASSALAGAASYSAAYARFVQSGDPDGCTVSALDKGCMVRSACPPIDRPPPLLSAGGLTIKGLPGGGIALPPGPTNDYALQASGTAWWNGGEHLTVSVEGGGAAAFTVELAAPTASSSLEVRLPVVDANGNISIKHQEWAGMLMHTKLHAPDMPDLGTVECLVYADAGTVTLPASANSPIFGLVDPQSSQLEISVVSVSVVKTATGSVVIELSGVDEVYAPKSGDAGLVP